MHIAHEVHGHQPIKMSYLWLQNEGSGKGHATSHETWDCPNMRGRRMGGRRRRRRRKRIRRRRS
jgi:hypothetical protein